MLPAAQRRKGAPAVHYVQSDFVTSEWAVNVDQEYARLAPARGDSPPPPDAKEAWRCSSCRYSACSKNTNPLKLEACPL